MIRLVSNLMGENMAKIVAAAALLMVTIGAAQAATSVVTTDRAAKSGIVVASDANKCIFNPHNCK
jgi:hypothetical protein